jgi:hypothetical protein
MCGGGDAFVGLSLTADAKTPKIAFKKSPPLTRAIADPGPGEVSRPVEGTVVSDLAELERQHATTQ